MNNEESDKKKDNNLNMNNMMSMEIQVIINLITFSQPNL